MSEKSLRLDPGPGRRRRGCRCSCKCLCWTISIPLLGFLGWATFLFLTAFLRGLRFPHQSLYHTGGPPYNSSEVIRPLIPQEQAFDIALTVWLRAPELEEAEFRRLQLENAPPKEEETPSPVQLDIKGLGKISASVILDQVDQFRDQHILETPLFSNIVFQGLLLSDKHRSTKVAFRLPTARFLSANLTESDLRATFLLLPSSPSLIDHIKNFSSWMPDSILANRPATRPWPFPPGSELSDEKTMADLALESFSVSVPLIEFHNVSSRCKSMSINGTDAACDDCEEPEAPVSKLHPHVVHRTQIRIIQETALFNATAYNAKHNELKKQSCGQGLPGLTNPKMCRPNYQTTGNFQTLIELEVPTESGVETQWAYAPHLSPKERAAGTLDILPVPVNRENCSTTRQDAPNVSDYMDIDLHIAFAGRSPLKKTLADVLTPPSVVNHSASEITKADHQNAHELWNAVFGHRFHDDSHPRRRIVMQIIGGGLQFLAVLISFHYWWTRVSTVGISSSSVVLLALGYSLGGTVEAIDQSDALWQYMVFVPMFLISPLLMLRCITRIEFGWNKWHPTLTRASANHRERTTQRVDSRTSWGTRLAFFAALLAAHQLFDNIILVASSMPDPRPGEFPEKKIVNFLQTVASCLCDTGTLSQALLNSRSATFAGGYRAEPIMHGLGFYTRLSSYYLALVVGRMKLRPALGLKSVMTACIQLPLIWQAFTLPPVEVRDDEED
ncbi:hypothetical protein B0H16DRAFT_1522677 [Mycena metata]|uniref:Uncharacterized protein n=1 Tax=Mycena metata TaxID=1033252 RepID=A0AAD7NM69_9AGAR|nr:hypothetical protein B0H16DRAFT_1522677 [Mycena metata]